MMIRIPSNFSEENARNLEFTNFSLTKFRYEADMKGQVTK